MVSPLLIAGLVAGGLGSAIQAREQAANQRRMQEAANDVIRRNRERQQAFAQQAQDRFAETQQEFTREQQEQRRGEAETERRETSQARVSDRLAHEGVPLSAPRNVMIASEEAGQRAKATGDRDAANMAALKAWGDLAAGNRIGLAQGGRDLGFIQDRAAGQEALVPISQQAARTNAYRAPSGLGTLLQLGGSVASMGAGRGWLDSNSLPGAEGFYGPNQNVPGRLQVLSKGYAGGWGF